jgi:superoxide dismutase
MRDYKATERGRYIAAFFGNVDWSIVQTRLEEERAVRAAA